MCYVCVCARRACGAIRIPKIRYHIEQLYPNDDSTNNEVSSAGSTAGSTGSTTEQGHKIRLLAGIVKDSGLKLAWL